MNESETDKTIPNNAHNAEARCQQARWKAFATRACSNKAWKRAVARVRARPAGWAGRGGAIISAIGKARNPLNDGSKPAQAGLFAEIRRTQERI